MRIGEVRAKITESLQKDEGMHDSCFYKNEKKHEVAIFENKHAQGRPKGKGYMIAATL